MKILFISTRFLGDAVLGTGALDHFIRTCPGAEVTVVSSPLAASLFRHAPGVVRVIEMTKEPYGRHWLQLWRQTAGTRWDIVVDLRNSLTTRLLQAGKRYIWSRQDPGLHRVEQIARMIGVTPPPAPVLWFDDATRRKAEALIPAGPPVLGLGPVAQWRAKAWPIENFIALVERLTAPESILPQARIAVFAAPNEENIARTVLDAVPKARQVDMIGKAEPLTVAAALQRCALYIGNDSGLMHCAAAVGTPTLGLFGPTPPQLYRPWGPRAAFVSTPEDHLQLTSTPGYVPREAPCLMTTLTVEMAEKAARALWQKTSAN